VSAIDFRGVQAHFGQVYANAANPGRTVHQRRDDRIARKW